LHEGGNMNAPVRPRILFVDDEPRILVSLRVIFKQDYDVVTAEGGAAGLEQIRNSKFDVIVSDQRMPGVTGVEVLRAAREQQPKAMRLLLTGYSDLNAIIGSINEGEIFRFISKPWSNVEIRATMAAAVKASSVEQITLPAATEGAGIQQAPSGVGVLVLDDDPQTFATLKNALESSRDVYAASTVEGCLEILAKQPVGVIFTELVVGGEEVALLLSALREHHPSLVVVVITRQADAGHSIELINHGQIYRLLLKPASDSVLRGTVNIAARRFQMLRQHPEQIQRIVVEPNPILQAPAAGGLLSRIKKILLPSWG
jgi:serine/threonine-protein kinase